MSRGPEGQIQDKIRNFLKQDGWLVNKIGLCSITGWPDLQCMKKGKLLLIEVKAPKQKPTHLQAYVHELIELYGFTVYTFDSYEKFKEEYKKIKTWVIDGPSIQPVRVSKAKKKDTAIDKGADRGDETADGFQGQHDFSYPITGDAGRP